MTDDELKAIISTLHPREPLPTLRQFLWAVWTGIALGVACCIGFAVTGSW